MSIRECGSVRGAADTLSGSFSSLFKYFLFFLCAKRILETENTPRERIMKELTHIDKSGNSRMVSVGKKDVTDREAIAEGWIELSSEACEVLRSGGAAKGDVLKVAQLAGICGAKRTADLIPLCHPIPLTGVDVALELRGRRVVVRASARASWRTGVEMEALASVTTALLTVFLFRGTYVPTPSAPLVAKEVFLCSPRGHERCFGKER